MTLTAWGITSWPMPYRGMIAMRLLDDEGSDGVREFTAKRWHKPGCISSRERAGAMFKTARCSYGDSHTRLFSRAKLDSFLATSTLRQFPDKCRTDTLVRRF